MSALSQVTVPTHKTWGKLRHQEAVAMDVVIEIEDQN
jgi:hypothetical protein